MIDIDALRKAHDEFLEVAAGGGFGPPPAMEWDAERVIAHVAAADAAIGSVALAVTGGQRVAYDNRASLDEQNLRRIIAGCGGLDGLIEFASVQGRVLCEVAGGMPESGWSVRVHVLIVSGDDLVVDEPWTIAELVTGVAAFHLPQHAGQLARLRG
ncbi:MAG: hypothetical protein J2P25_12095 [Nocardiopsaceae bacterium]|nr:hypothetical protein [Nocardiopsaceae bacterium]